MAAVTGGSREDVAELAATIRAEGGEVWLANHNSPHQSVIAGSDAAVGALLSRATQAGLRCSVLPVSAACHSPYMEPAHAALRDALDRATFQRGTLPVIANVDARPHHGGMHWRKLCSRQLTSPVRWADSLTTLHTELGATAFLDVGPGRTLAGLARRTLPAVPVRPGPVPVS